MVGERMQRRIDGLLDEADAAVVAEDWDTVAARCRAVLALDPDNVDASEYLKAAERGSAAGTTNGVGPSFQPAPDARAPVQPSHPSSFVAGRYRVERFLGEGGRKRVFLAHDTTLDRDIAFAQIRTEGLDDLARERVMREAQSMPGSAPIPTSSPSTTSARKAATPTSSVHPNGRRGEQSVHRRGQQPWHSSKH